MPKSKGRKKSKATQRPPEENGGGVMMSLRGGFKRVAAGEGKAKGLRSPVAKALDIAFWVLVIAAVLFLAFRRFR